MMLKKLFVLLSGLTLAAAPALAGPCEKSYRVSGVPLVTPIVFTVSQDFTKTSAEQALARMARAVRAEDFSGIKVNEKRGTISAYQETSGSGRPQSLLVVVKSGKKGIRASATFKIQAGQLAEDKYVRRSLCKIVGAADG